MSFQTPTLYCVNVTREEVKQGDIKPFIAKMRQFFPPKGLAGKFVFLIDGYNDTPHELYTIPEVRAYWKKLDEAWPFLLYFAECEFSECLQIISFCLHGNISARSIKGELSCVQYDIPELMRWVSRRFAPMNHLFEDGEDESEIEQAIFERTEQIFKAYNLPFNPL